MMINQRQFRLLIPSGSLSHTLSLSSLRLSFYYICGDIIHHIISHNRNAKKVIESSIAHLPTVQVWQSGDVVMRKASMF